MSGWVLVRLMGIALGIVTLLGFASGYLGVEFKPYFKNVLDWLEKHLVDFIVRPEEVEWALDYMRQHFAWVPKPDAHWKPIYTLSALFMLSMARHGRLWYLVPIALACSLVPAVFAGTMPVGSVAVVFWPLAGFIAFVAILGVLQGNWRAALLSAAFAAALAAAGYFIGNTGEGTIALVVLAALVGAMGLGFLVLTLLFTEGTLWQRLQYPFAAIGLDITATLGLALAIGYLVAA